MRFLTLLFLAGCGSSGLTIAMVQQNNSGQDGQATLIDGPAGLEITVELKPSNIAGNQTSHVHEGRCDDVGRITAGLSPISDKGEPANSDGGIITFHATFTGKKLSDFKDGNHVINVHDARDNSLYVSCGEIPP